MSVITTDILIEGHPRDEVLTWLGNPANHGTILNGAYGGFTEKSANEFEVSIKGGIRTRPMGYRFEKVDEEHGGRRVHVSISGKRTNGKLHYSLRTMKPAANTLVTLHCDFDPGGPGIGMLAELLGLRDNLEGGFKKVLENLKRELG